MVVGLALSVLIGISLGLLGGGGSILTVPILVYVLGVETKSAIATSLLVVGVTSAAAVIPHARAGRVRWRTAVVFGAAGMLGAYASGRVAHFIPGGVLLVAFGLMMLATGVAMLRERKPREADRAAPPPGELPIAMILVEGAVVGAVTGLVGAGGGFLVVPALVLLGRLPMGAAIGSSLVVITMKSLAGMVGYLGHATIDWGLAGAVTVAAVAGSVLGGLLAGRVAQGTLRKAFAWFVVAMGVYVLARQIPAPALAAYWPWLLAGIAAAGGAAALALLLRGSRRSRRARASRALGPTIPRERRGRSPLIQGRQSGSLEVFACYSDSSSIPPRPRIPISWRTRAPARPCSSTRCATRSSGTSRC